MQFIRVLCVACGIALSSGASAQVNCSIYGGQTYCSNGQTFSTYGNQTFDNRGNSWSQFGNQTYGSNGRICSRYGNQVYCN